MSQASTGFLQQARALLDDGRAWAGLGGDALAFVLADLCQSGRWLVVVDEPDAYDRLISGLSFFLTDRSRLAPYPADDCRPYDGFSPSPQVVRRRLKTLAQLEGGGDILVVAPGAALAPLVPDAGARRSGRQTVATGDVLDRDELVSALITAGYLVSAQVMEEGFVARRGDIVDVWPTFHRHPVRIDFFDDEVESVRAFHPGTRRTVESLERVTILPAREERLDAEALRRASTELARWTTEQRRDNRLRRRILEDLKAGIRFSGLSAYLPALVSTEAPLQAMSGLQTLVVSPEDVAAALRDWERNARDRWSALDDTDRPLVPPEERAQSAEEVLEQLKDAHKVWDLAAQGQAVDLGARAPDGYSVRGADLKPVVRKLRQLSAAGVRVGLVCDTEKRADTLREMLDRHELYPVPRARPTDLRPEQVAILVGDLPRGFVAQESGWAFIPASALFGGAKRRARMDRIHAFFDASVTSVEQIREEDLVVHRLHGVGRYRGLKRMDAQDGVVQDFATVEFRGGDLLYLPVTRLSDLSRYVPSKEGVIEYPQSDHCPSHSISIFILNPLPFAVDGMVMIPPLP